MIMWLFIAFALLIGALLPLQAGLNAQLRLLLPHPVIAALISFLVGSGILAVVSLFLRINWISSSRLSSAPWWLWTGGIFGANYVLVALILAPRLGAATLIGLTVTGQMISSVVLDHFGLVGYPLHPVSAGRLVGAGLLLVGTLLIQRF
jgi:bacterial/archaeal transporter family-2 protein